MGGVLNNDLDTIQKRVQLKVFCVKVKITKLKNIIIIGQYSFGCQ